MHAHGSSVSEIAAALHAPHSTIWSIVNRAKRKQPDEQQVA
jgi:DNA-directed RNA polymerase specialized sigma24 family protein